MDDASAVSRMTREIMHLRQLLRSAGVTPSPPPPARPGESTESLMEQEIVRLRQLLLNTKQESRHTPEDDDQWLQDISYCSGLSYQEKLNTPRCQQFVRNLTREQRELFISLDESLGGPDRAITVQPSFLRRVRQALDRGDDA